MTAITSINCSDGIVVGSDGQRSVDDIVGFPVNKIQTDVKNNTIVTTAGSVGLGNKFKEIGGQYPNVQSNQ